MPLAGHLARRRVLAALPLLAVPTLGAQALGAQALESLPAGARVRVERTGAGARMHGTLLRADSGRVLVLVERGVDTAVVALDRSTRVDVSAGYRTPGQAAARGAAVGALIGLGVGVVATTTALVVDSRNTGDYIIPGSVIVGAMSLLFVGASTVVGGAIGLGHRERWARVWPGR